VPTRYLKPGIRDSEAIDGLKPLAETLFYRLIVTVDDYGRADARPAMVKAACFPVKKAVTEEMCEQLLIELGASGLVLLYIVDGKPYLQLQKWDNKPRASASNFPAPADGCAQTYTHADNPRTLLPVTVTGTGTETATETETETPAKPAARKRAAPTAGIPCPDDVDPQTWSDWCDLRKRKKTTVSLTAITVARREADKAKLSLDAFLQVWVMRGSQGFEAGWITPAELERVKPTAKSFADTDAAARYRRTAENSGGRIAGEYMPGASRSIEEVNAEILDVASPAPLLGP
jgi:hypothetical protein